MSDLITSWLRTVVPGIWAALIGGLTTWASVHAPWLLGALGSLGIDLSSPAATAFVIALTLAAWYAVWRRLEPHMPDWLTRVVLGSAKAPMYLNTIRDGAPLVAGRVLPDAEASTDITEGR